MRRLSLRLGALIVGVGGLVVGLAGPAAAHIGVTPATATEGEYATVTFSVPNEREDASTVKVELFLPTQTPVAVVHLRPVPGWSARVVTAKLATPIKTDDGEVTEAISQITWTATASAAIQPGQFQQFDVSMGPLPATDQLVFKVIQGYSNGEVDQWIDPPKADGSEPANPGPVLKITKAADPAPASASPAPADSSRAAPATGTSTGLTTALSIAGFVLGLAGLALALLAYRRTTTAPTH